jgi:hypothetical protein
MCARKHRTLLALLGAVAVLGIVVFLTHKHRIDSQLPANLAALAAAASLPAGQSAPTDAADSPTASEVMEAIGECRMLAGDGGSALGGAQWSWQSTDPVLVSLERTKDGYNACKKAADALQAAITRSLEKEIVFGQAGFDELNERTKLLAQETEVERNLRKTRGLFTEAADTALTGKRHQTIPADQQWIEALPQATGRDGLVMAVLEINRDEAYRPGNIKMANFDLRQDLKQEGIDDKWRAWEGMPQDYDHMASRKALATAMCTAIALPEGFLSLPHIPVWLSERQQRELRCGCPEWSWRERMAAWLRKDKLEMPSECAQ